MTDKFDSLWVVTVNWNKPELTEACLQSILQNGVPPSQMILVDNGSTDDSLAYFQKHLPSIRVIASDVNLGFAGGFNLGIHHAREAGARYIFIVNNDTEVLPGTMETLYVQAKSLNADIAAPAIYYADQPDQLWSAGGDFSSLFAAPVNAHQRNAPLPPEPIERGFLSGCALLIQRHVFDTIGAFDEDFFLYYEDLDFMKRADKAGFSRWLIPDAKLRHHVSASSEGALSPTVAYWMSRSSWLYFHKHAAFWQWFFILPWRLGHTLKTLLLFIFRNQWDNLLPYLSGFLMIKDKKFSPPDKPGQNNP